MKRFGLFLACLLFGVFLVPSRAAEGLNLVTSPLPIVLTADPGSTVSAQLKVKNGGNEPETIRVGLMKFSAYGERGEPRLLDRESGDDYFDWVKFSEEVFTLAPNEWKTVNMNINVPPEASLGYYYAVTFTRQEEAEEVIGPRATKIVGATASLVLLDVKVPNAIREVEVVEFSVDKKIFEFLPVNFNIKLKNRGNVHIAPRGNIFIGNGGKKDLAVLEINEFKGNILPNSNRAFETQWGDGFPVFEDKTEDGKVVTDEKGNPVKRLRWDFGKVSKLRFGKFSANMLLIYDDGQRDIPIEGQLSFWVIPWRMIAVAVVLGFIVLDWLRGKLSGVFSRLKKTK